MNLLSKKQALAVTYTRTIPLWLRYVDETFTAVCKDEIDDFHEHIKKAKSGHTVTKEIEENSKTSFFSLEKKNAKNSELMLIPHYDHDAVSSPQDSQS